MERYYNRIGLLLILDIKCTCLRSLVINGSCIAACYRRITVKGRQHVISRDSMCLYILLQRCFKCAGAEAVLLSKNGSHTRRFNPKAD